MHQRLRAAIGLCSLAVLVAASAAAQEPEPTPSASPSDTVAPASATPLVVSTSAILTHATQAPGQELEIIADAPRNAASNQDLLDKDLALRAHNTMQDILTSVPGLYVAQHAGGGKAYQYFLRGFDADHGTDIAFFVDGVPINLPTHGHGQGYSDLHFLIPEMIDKVQVYKGPYYAQFGDFATAGAVNFVTHPGLNYNQQEVAGGMFQTYRSLTILSPYLPAWQPLLAAEVYHSNGPFTNPNNWLLFNFFGKITHEFSAYSSLTVAATSYVSDWDASGQLPQRAVEEGLLGRFGSEDPSEGGNSQRQMLYARLRHTSYDGSELDLTAYVQSYRLSLFSDFTFYQVNSIDADEVNQTDARTVYGTTGSYKVFRLLAGQVPSVTTFGFWSRNDSIVNGLFSTFQRQQIGVQENDVVEENAVAFYAEESLVPTSWFRAIGGVRADYIGVQVDDLAHHYDTVGDSGSGQKSASQLSPKLSVVITPDPSLDVYLNYGRGFHSNDARGVAQPSYPATLISRADGYEVGARTTQFDHRLDLTAAAFLMYLQSELVWNGDTGGTSPNGPTERYGTELTARWQVLPWLFADSDLTLAHATYTRNAGNGSAVALAPREIYQGGISVRRPDGLYGRISLFQIGDRPATPDGSLTAKGFARVDASAGVKKKRWSVQLDLQNATNTPWDEAQFANTSRLKNETSPSDCPKGTSPDFGGPGGSFDGCNDIHFTPGNPINIQGSVSLFF